MCRKEQRSPVGGDVRLDLGGNSMQQLDQLGLAQFLGSLAKALSLVEAAGAPAGRSRIPRALVFGDAGDGADPLRQIDPLNFGKGPARVCPALIANNRNGPASSRTGNNGLM